MKAVVAQGPGKFELTELAEPKEYDGGRVLSVEAVGVCAADRMLWHGTGPWQVHWPITPGHEILARDVHTGERFTVEVSVPCGRCRRCASGRTNLCPHGRHVGSDVPGGFAERLALPSDALLHPVSEALTTRCAVLAEPLACAVHAADRAGISSGDTVAVIGLGAVGALTVHVARARGARQVLAVVRTDARAELARALGAEPVRAGTSLSPDDAADTVDAVVECSGDPDAARTALRLAAPGGRVCLYSVYQRPAQVDLNQIAEFKELTVLGGHLAPGCFPEAVRLLPTVPADLIVTAMRPLPDYAQALDDPTGPRVKEVLLP